MCKFFDHTSRHNIAQFNFCSFISQVELMKGQRVVNFFERLYQLLLQSNIFFTFSTFQWIFRAALKNLPGQTRWTAIGSIVARSKIKTPFVSRCRSISGGKPRRRESHRVFVKSRLHFSLFNRILTSLHPSALGCTRFSFIHFSFSRSSRKAF